MSATLTFDLRAAPPSLTAAITNAVLEGGEPFALTVRSSSGWQQMDGTYRFMGDYLRDIYPSGTQYLFDWRFSPSTNGEIVWNGTTGWSGGHAWYVTISNITLAPVPWLSIARAGMASVEIAWATNFADHALEFATLLPGSTWTSVTNAPVVVGDRFVVSMDTAISNRFYRLRRP